MVLNIFKTKNTHEGLIIVICGYNPFWSLCKYFRNGRALFHGVLRLVPLLKDVKILINTVIVLLFFSFDVFNRIVNNVDSHKGSDIDNSVVK